MELISETATGDQVRGPRREKGHEQSNMRFLLYRDEAKISCNTEMYQLMLKRKMFFKSKGDTLIFIAPPFVADSFNFGTNADDD